MTWQADYYPDLNSCHIVPIADAIDHSPSDACVCGPTADPVNRKDGSIGWVLTHHSLDGREHHE